MNPLKVAMEDHKGLKLRAVINKESQDIKMNSSGCLMMTSMALIDISEFIPEIKHEHGVLGFWGFGVLL